MKEANRFLPEEWEARLEGIDLEIARQAIICKVRLLEPGVAERVLQNDTSVCGADHAQAFQTLRGLLVMHFTELNHLSDIVGPEQSLEVAQRVRAHLRPRIGEQLGVPREPAA